MLRNLLPGAARLLLAGATSANACSTTNPPPTTEQRCLEELCKLSAVAKK